MSPIEVFSPVNIAWLKYMGKTDVKNNLPANSSLSVTLKNAGTRVVAHSHPASQLSIEFGVQSAWLRAEGKERVQRFLTRIEPKVRECLKGFSLNPVPQSVRLQIETENTIPERAGIASSASSFSAYTLMFAIALSEDHQSARAELDRRGAFLSELARISSLGSGSSGRSMFAPFCLWNEEGFHPVASQHTEDFVHIIALFEEAPKEVSSSEAHIRVPTSRYFSKRKHNVERRFAEIDPMIRSGRLLECSSAVAQEAFEMHLLFETSVPPFSYLTLDALAAARTLAEDRRGVLTIDAGTNLHWLTKKSEAKFWQERLAAIPGVKRVLLDEIGGGPSWT